MNLDDVTLRKPDIIKKSINQISLASMIDNINLSNILFLDIETVPQAKNVDELDENFHELWKHKAKSFIKKEEQDITAEEWAASYERAGIYAEFGKIICISVGFLSLNAETNKYQCRLKSFKSDNEKELLEQFASLLDKAYNIPEKHFLCGHNIKEFDIPYICRRMTVHRMKLPKLLDITGKKPWETKHLLDTMELWKFGDNKNFTSIKLLAAIFGFPSPKDDIDGSQVGYVYWQENDLNRIATYCEKDVLAVVQLLLCFKRMDILDTEQVFFVK